MRWELDDTGGESLSTAVVSGSRIGSSAAIDMGSDADWPAAVGPSWGEVVAPKGDAIPPIGVRLRVLLDVLIMLDRVHSNESLPKRVRFHGAVRPGNVIVGFNGMSQLGPTFNPDQRSLKVRAADLGYTPPEMMSKKYGPSRSSDVFAVSVMLWEALSGQRLFTTSDAREMLNQIKTGVHLSRDSIPAWGLELIPLLQLGLSYQPRERGVSIRDLAEALSDASRGHLARRREVAAHVQEFMGVDPNLVKQHLPPPQDDSPLSEELDVIGARETSSGVGSIDFQVNLEEPDILEIDTVPSLPQARLLEMSRRQSCDLNGGDLNGGDLASASSAERPSDGADGVPLRSTNWSDERIPPASARGSSPEGQPPAFPAPTLSPKSVPRASFGGAARTGSTLPVAHSPNYAAYGPAVGDQDSDWAPPGSHRKRSAVTIVALVLGLACALAVYAALFAG